MRGAASPANELAEDVLDEFFKDVDHSIRELGVGDPSVPKRMKKLARMFYGRMGIYWSAIDNNDAEALGDAVARNVAPDAPQTIASAEIAEYMMRSAETLAGISDEEMLSGVVRFAEPLEVAQS
jgi:cytochrome b pre-mRNA-processing protein 3